MGQVIDTLVTIRSDEPTKCAKFVRAGKQMAPFNREQSMSAFNRINGGLHRSAQHFILKEKDGVTADGTKKTLGLHRGKEDGVMGSLAARGVIECDWASIW